MKAIKYSRIEIKRGILQVLSGSNGPLITTIKGVIYIRKNGKKN